MPTRRSGTSTTRSTARNSRKVVLRRFDEIKKLAQSTGDATRGKGNFYPAHDPGSLVAALEHSLELKKYQVRKRDGQPFTPEPVDINTTVTLRQINNPPVACEASVVDPQRPAAASFELQGGEAIELYLSEGALRLEHRRYNKEKRVNYESLEDPVDPERRFYVAAHLPRWEPDNADLSFFFSIQNADEKQFSPRPAEAWVQITPILPSGQPQGTQYNFFDLEFKPHLPVPMLVCRANNWPPEASEAKVELWFRMKRTEINSSEAITVGEFRRRGGITLDGIPGLRFDLETRDMEGGKCRVIVIERHPPGSSLDQARVEMDGAYSRVVRHYTHQVQHTFYFDDTTVSALDPRTVTILPRSRIINRAVTLPRPFQVVVPPRGFSIR